MDHSPNPTLTPGTTLARVWTPGEGRRTHRRTVVWRALGHLPPGTVLTFQYGSVPQEWDQPHHDQRASDTPSRLPPAATAAVPRGGAIAEPIPRARPTANARSRTRARRPPYPPLAGAHAPSAPTHSTREKATCAISAGNHHACTPACACARVTRTRRHADSSTEPIQSSGRRQPPPLTARSYGTRRSPSRVKCLS